MFYIVFKTFLKFILFIELNYELSKIICNHELLIYKQPARVGLNSD